MSKLRKMQDKFENSPNKTAIIAMTFAQAVGFAIQESLSRGLINTNAADFIVARTDEFHRTLLAGGVLTRLPNGLYVEDKTKKETGNDEQ